LLSGTVDVRGGQREIARLQAGAHIGEMSLFDDQSSGVDVVVATTDDAPSLGPIAVVLGAGYLIAVVQQLVRQDEPVLLVRQELQHEELMKLLVLLELLLLRQKIFWQLLS
jgi:CRP-like cAMP-binding protein